MESYLTTTCGKDSYKIPTRFLWDSRPPRTPEGQLNKSLWFPCGFLQQASTIASGFPQGFGGLLGFHHRSEMDPLDPFKILEEPLKTATESRKEYSTIRQGVLEGFSQIPPRILRKALWSGNQKQTLQAKWPLKSQTEKHESNWQRIFTQAGTYIPCDTVLIWWVVPQIQIAISMVVAIRFVVSRRAEPPR